MEETLEQTKHVNALLTEGDKAILYKYAAKVPDNGTIVDIGTASGGSAFIMTMASKPSVKVYTIDPVINEHFLAKRKEFELEDKLSYFEKTSEAVSKEWEGEIDMLFVDGIHNEHGVQTDFDGLGQFVKKGGIIAFHDVVMYANTIGACVNRLIGHGLIEEIETNKDEWKDGRITGLLVSRKL